MIKEQLDVRAIELAPPQEKIKKRLGGVDGGGGEQKVRSKAHPHVRKSGRQQF